MPSSIKVNKADLIAKIIEERAKHKDIYDEAVIAYTEQFVANAKKFAEDAVARAATGKGFVQMQWLPVPEEHTDDFDRAIEMLQWEVEDEVTLDETDFTQLVQNKWHWARAFATSTMSYTGSGR
jgi:hypothetical protein